jgi:hypothetical protein
MFSTTETEKKRKITVLHEKQTKQPHEEVCWKR